MRWRPRGSERPRTAGLAAPDGRPVEDGDALVVATSGTTGAPEGVVLTHDAVRASAEATSERVGVDRTRPTAGSRACRSPTSEACRWSPARSSRTHRSRCFLHSTSTVVAAAARRGCTLVSLVPTALRRIDAARFRVIVLGGRCAARGPPAERRDDLRDDRDRQRCRLRRAAPRRRRGGDRRRRRQRSCCEGRCCCAATATASTRSSAAAGSPPATSGSSPTTAGSSCTGGAAT